MMSAVADDRPPFDVVRATFFLIAGVISIYGLVILLGMAACVYWSRTIIEQASITCDPQGRLSELLAAALAAALAFMGGNRMPPPPSKPPRSPDSPAR
jgi:hypothetical protein